MKKQKKNKQSGITLIALVISIIVMLILAGVSINAIVGENGVLTKAQMATVETKKSQEREAIQFAVASQLLEYADANIESNITIGEELYDKKQENSTKWNIISRKSDNKVFGTGWIFFEKGNELEGYGTLQQSWLVSDKTDEIIELEENSYTKLSYKDALGTTDKPMFSLDPSLMDNFTNEEKLEADCGKGVDFIGFDWNESSGIANGELRLDGIDDYINIDFTGNDYQSEKERMKSNGFTFEFFGKVKSGNKIFYGEEWGYTNYSLMTFVNSSRY